MLIISDIYVKFVDNNRHKFDYMSKFLHVEVLFIELLVKSLLKYIRIYVKSLICRTFANFFLNFF